MQPPVPSWQVRSCYQRRIANWDAIVCEVSGRHICRCGRLCSVHFVPARNIFHPHRCILHILSPLPQRHICGRRRCNLLCTVSRRAHQSEGLHVKNQLYAMRPGFLCCGRSLRPVSTGDILRHGGRKWRVRLHAVSRGHRSTQLRCTYEVRLHALPSWLLCAVSGIHGLPALSPRCDPPAAASCGTDADPSLSPLTQALSNPTMTRPHVYRALLEQSQTIERTARAAPGAPTAHFPPST